MKQSGKAIISVILAYILISISVKSQEDNMNYLSLDDVIYLAKEQSPDALIAKHRFRSSYWEFRSFKADYL